MAVHWATGVSMPLSKMLPPDSTLVIPPALTNGPVEFLALVVAIIASFRLPPLVVLAIGMAIVIIGRQLGF